MSLDRRTFLASSGAGAAAAAGVGLLGLSGCRSAPEPKPRFRLSLAEWSLHRALHKKEITNLDFAGVAGRLGFEGIEYVNSFFKTKAKDKGYLSDLNKAADDAGVKQLLIMCDGEGHLGDPDDRKRQKTVENHYRWVEAAKFLGCHSIRVNAHSKGKPEEQRRLVADGLRRLSEFGAEHDINVIVENHGGLSSNGAWLAAVMKDVDHPRCGTLPDFGNFRLGGGKEYDRYKGVRELMPYAKAVSAKSHDFDEHGNETRTDFFRMMRIVLAYGYDGYVGVEYEGRKIKDEEKGILLTKALLERVRVKATAEHW